MHYRKILHVDDDPDDCELFYDALRTVSDADYIAINDPIKALHELESLQICPDVIVVDLNMPIINGMEFLAAVKRMIHLQNVPVIIFSTSSLSETEKKVRKLGAFDYLVKPDDFLGLKKILQQKF